MEGVTTAIVAFIFVCLIWPHIVKNKPQYYGALALVLLIILFGAIAQMAIGRGLWRVMYVLIAVAQILSILLLVMSIGGLTARQLRSEMMDTVQTLRHGGQEKPMEVPRTSQTPKPGEEPIAPPPAAPNATTGQPPSIPLS